MHFPGRTMNLRTLLSSAVAATPLAYLPVRVRAGPAKGALWTLAPFSHNWRHGGEGDLEPALARLANRIGASCWDFGAHFGIHAVGMAMSAGPTGQVAAFEPDPVAFDRLRYHVRRNRLENVVLFQAAVSDKPGSLKLIATNGLGSSMSHFQYEDEEISANTPLLEVETVVADDLVSAGRIRPPDLIKVDLQGHGARALTGAASSIRAHRPVIVFSNHSKWELEGTRALLDPMGYRVYSQKGEPIEWGDLATDSSYSESGLLLPAGGPNA
jgi:FkbM family methyltransferase